MKAEAAAFLEHELLSQIPLTRAMQLRVVDYDGSTLRLAAPLAPNVNDKGCAFGGSLASLLTLACWGSPRGVGLQHALQEQPRDSGLATQLSVDVVDQRAQLLLPRPLRGDLDVGHRRPRDQVE